MKSKYSKVILCLAVVLFFGFTGCNKEAERQKDNESDTNISEEQESSDTKIAYDNETNIEELKEQELSDIIETLSLPYAMRKILSVGYNVEELRADGIAEIVRYHKGKYYSVARVEGGRYLFLLYYGTDIEDNFLIDGFLVSGFADKAFFEDISKGMKQEEIIKNDPSACIVWDGERSYHRFSDKSMLEIRYTLEDDQYIVSGFEFLEEPLSVLNYLLPQDLEKILPSEYSKEAGSEYDDRSDTDTSKEQELFMIPYDNESDIEELKERKLSDKIKELNLPYCMRLQVSDIYDIEILKSGGIAEIVRYHNDRYYSVTRVEGGKYLFLLYYGTEMGDDRLIDGFLVSDFADKAFFEDISKGMKQEEIIKNDPSACIVWDGERSYHRFSDKSILEIKYKLEDDQYIVSEFEFLEDQLSVLDYLLPEDFEKILS